jgi:hypothetical protein
MSLHYHFDYPSIFNTPPTKMARIQTFPPADTITTRDNRTATAAGSRFSSSSTKNKREKTETTTTAALWQV